MATTPSPGGRFAAALLLFAVSFTTLAVASYTQKSATWDEPIHLTAGYAGLARGDFRIDPSHPPFLRMWAALPLLAMPDVALDTTVVNDTDATAWLTGPAYALSHSFLYRLNDADRLLYAGRFMIVLLGLLLGVLLFSWTFEWLGFRPALLALLFYTISPNIAAHASLVTTDLGITCFVFGAIYFLWRTCRQVTALNVSGVSLFVALALVSKFSAVILLPLVALLLALASLSWRMVKPAVAAGILVAIAMTSVAAVWAVYGFRYAPSQTPGWLFDVEGLELVRQHLPRIAPLFGWIDGHHLLPNAFTQGFLFSVGTASQLPSYLAGEISRDGWWYYFPVAFLVKTPVPLIALLATGLVVFARRWHKLGATNEAFILLPIVTYLAFAIGSGINIGLRHILPVYPFVLLIAATAADTAIAYRHVAGRLTVAAVTLFWIVRFGVVYPHTLTFFNQAAGGPRGGLRYLADSNLDWGQHLKGLKRWMDDNGVEHINLAYFGQADPAYYGINATHLAGAPSFAIDMIRKPTLPGYVAISGTILTGAYLPPAWSLFYRGFQEQEPIAEIGYSIRVYWVDEWPEPDRPADATAAELEAHAFLADALFLGQQWPGHALVHYQQYLKQRPDDARVLERSGMALARLGQMGAALDAFKGTVALDPDNADAHRRLAVAQLAAGDPVAAETHARRSLELAPGDPAAHDLLGQILAVQGRFAAAGAEFQRALEHDPTHADARLHMEMLRRQPKHRGLD